VIVKMMQVIRVPPMKKRISLILISIILFLGLSAGAFFIYVSDYYRADGTALAVM